MKKKIILFVCIVLAVCLPIFSSCTNEDTPPEQTVREDGTYFSPTNGTLQLQGGTFMHIYLDDERNTHYRKGSYTGTDKNVILSVTEEDNVLLSSPDTLYVALEGDSFSVLTDMTEKGEEQTPGGEIRPTCEHKATALTRYLAPTCTEDGYTGDKICLDCREVLIEGKVIRAVGHNFSAESDSVFRPAICTENELRYHSCAVCHEVSRDEKDVYEVPDTANGEHLYTADSGITAKQATCTSDREDYCACVVCGAVFRSATKTFVVPDSRLPHRFTVKNKEHLCKAADCGHNDIYYLVCADCGLPSNDINLVYEVEGTATNLHDFSEPSGFVASDATCVDDRVEYARCKTCGMVDTSKTVTVPDTATGAHLFTVVSDVVASPATCLTDQYNYYECRFCGLVSRQKTARIVATAHSHEYKNHICKECGNVDTGSVRRTWDISADKNRDEINAYLFDNEDKYDLVVKGTGKTKNYASASSVPWASYQTAIAHVFLADEITSVGDFLFAGCALLSDVRLYNDETPVSGAYLPSSITAIGNYAFNNCPSLCNLILPVETVSVGIAAFAGCVNLTEIDFSLLTNLTTLRRNAFQGDVSLETAYLNGTALGSVEESVFENCAALTTVTLPSAATYIGGYAFADSALGGALSLPSSLKNIGEYAFLHTDVSSVVIPASVKTIGSFAFYGCSSLADVDMTSATVLTDIGKNAFEETAFLQSAPGDAIYAGDVLLKVKPTFEGALTLRNGTRLIANDACRACLGMTSVTLCAELTHIGREAFRSCLAVRDVDFSSASNLSEIGAFAFSDCPLLLSVALPAGLTYVGDGAFENCAQLRSFSYRGGVSEENDILKNTHIFEVYRPNDGSADFSATVVHTDDFSAPTVIDSDDDFVYAYYDEKGYLIGYKQTSRTEISLPLTFDCNGKKVTSYAVGDFAFAMSSYYPQMVNLVIPSSVESIGKNAFADCATLETIDMSLSVRSVGEKAFYNTAFYNDKKNWNNVSLYLPTRDDDGEKYYLIEVAPTKETAVTKLSVQANTVVIADKAFEKCVDLTSLTFPDSVRTMGAHLLDTCTKLVDLTLPVVGKSKNEEGYLGFLFGADGYEQNALVLPPSLTAVNVISCDAIPEYAFYECSSLQTVTLSSSVENVGKYAFFNCSSTALTVGGELRSVGEYAFYNCTGLRSVEFSSALKEIPRYAFFHTGLIETVLPGGTKTVGEYAFAECYLMYSLTVGNAVASLGVGAFRNCINLVTVLLGSGLNGNEGTIDVSARSLTLGSTTYYYGDSGTIYGPDNVGTINKSDLTFTLNDVDYYYDDGTLYADPSLDSPYALPASSISVTDGVIEIGQKVYTFDKNKRAVFANAEKTVQVEDVCFDPSEKKFTYAGTVTYYYNTAGAIYSDVGLHNRILNTSINTASRSFIVVPGGASYYYNGSAVYFDRENQSPYVGASIDTSAKSIVMPMMYTYYYDGATVYGNSTKTLVVENASVSEADNSYAIDGTTYYYGEKCAVFIGEKPLVGAYIDFNDDFKKVKSVYLPEALSYYFDSTGSMFADSERRNNYSGSLMNAISTSFNVLGKTYYYDGDGKVYSDSAKTALIDGMRVSKTLTITEHPLYYYGADGKIYYDQTKYKPVEDASIDLTNRVFILNGNSYSYDATNGYIYSYGTTTRIDSSSGINTTLKTIAFPTDVTYYYTDNGFVYRDAALTNRVGGTEIDVNEMTYSVHTTRYFAGQDGKYYTNEALTGSPVENMGIARDATLPINVVYFFNGNNVYTSYAKTPDALLDADKYKINVIATPSTLMMNGTTYYFNSALAKAPVYTDPAMSDEYAGAYVCRSNGYFVFPTMRSLSYVTDGTVYTSNALTTQEKHVSFDTTAKTCTVYDRFYYTNDLVYADQDKHALTTNSFNRTGYSFTHGGTTYYFDDAGKVYSDSGKTSLIAGMSVSTTDGAYNVPFATYYYNDKYEVFTDRKMNEISKVNGAVVSQEGTVKVSVGSVYYFDKFGYVYADRDFKNILSSVRISLKNNTYSVYSTYYYYNESGEVYTSSDLATLADEITVSPKSGVVFIDETKLYFNQNKVYSSVSKTHDYVVDGAFIDVDNDILTADEEYYLKDGGIYIDREHGAIDVAEKSFTVGSVTYSYGQSGDETGIYTDMYVGDIFLAENRFSVSDVDYYLSGTEIKTAVGSVNTVEKSIVLNENNYSYNGGMLYDENLQNAGVIDEGLQKITLGGIEYFYENDGTILKNVGSINHAAHTLTVNSVTYTFDGEKVYRKIRKREIEEDCFVGCEKLVEVRNISSVVLNMGQNNYGSVAKYALRIVTTDASELKFDDEIDKKFLLMYVGGEYYLLGYIGQESSAVMPSEYNRVHPTYSLYKYAFAKNYVLKNITFSNNVAAVSDYAFYQCENLSRVTFGSAQTSIGKYAFAMSSLPEISLPSNLVTVGDYAFLSCADLSVVTFGSKVKTVGTGAFSDCVALTYVTLPSSLTSIGTKAFYGCTAVTELSVPSFTSASIGTKAFGYLTSLKKVTWKAFITLNASSEIFFRSGDKQSGIAFGFDALATVPAYLTYTQLAKDAPYVTSVSLAAGITKIGAYAFMRASIRLLELPSTLTSVDTHAFAESSVTRVAFPSTLTSLGSYAFQNASALEEATFSTGLTALPEGAFYGCAKLTVVSLPASIKTIGQSAFFGCENLRLLGMSSGVTSVGANALSGCDALLYVYIVGSDSYDIARFGAGNDALDGATFIYAFFENPSVVLSRGSTTRNTLSFEKDGEAYAPTSIAYQSSSVACAAVNASGLVTAQNSGSTAIIATITDRVNIASVTYTISLAVSYNVAVA